jgi:hypothetical protein
MCLASMATRLAPPTQVIDMAARQCAFRLHWPPGLQSGARNASCAARCGKRLDDRMQHTHTCSAYEAAQPQVHAVCCTLRVQKLARQPVSLVTWPRQVGRGGVLLVVHRQLLAWLPLCSIWACPSHAPALVPPESRMCGPALLVCCSTGASDMTSLGMACPVDL